MKVNSVVMDVDPGVGPEVDPVLVDLRERNVKSYLDMVRENLSGRGVMGVSVEVRKSVVCGQRSILRLTSSDGRQWVELCGRSFDQLMAWCPAVVTEESLFRQARTIEGVVGS
jgi:hypothetical protein